jgi:hypothetical protein
LIDAVKIYFLKNNTQQKYLIFESFKLIGTFAFYVNWWIINDNNFNNIKSEIVISIPSYNPTHYQ